MSIKITRERIIAVAKKLNVYNPDLAIDEMLDRLMDKIEELAGGKAYKWKNNNADIVKFYNDVVEEMEKMLEYEGTFF